MDALPEKRKASIRQRAKDLGIPFPSNPGELLSGTKNEPNRLFFDIESTRLDAAWGVCLCIGYKLGNGKIEVPTIHDFPHRDILDDKGLVRYFAEEVYPNADITIGHYSSRFDIPFINSRLIHHGLPCLPRTHHIDTWRIAKYKLKLDSNRLARLIEFLKVKDSKTAVDPEHWRRAGIGCEKSIKYIVQHCVYDIKTLEQCYTKLLKANLVDEPLHKLFDDNASDGCPKCGSNRVQRRGISVTLTRRYPRYHCQSCGKWSRGNKTETSGLALVGG